MSNRWLITAAVILMSGLVAVLLTGADPREAGLAALQSSLGSGLALQETLAKTTPLLWCGLAVALAFRAGVWNIGAEGQLLIGAVLATAAALFLPPLGWVSPFLALLAGACGGALWAGCAAVLKVFSGVNEILSTILLNLVAVSLLGWAVHSVLQEPGGTYPQSARIARELWLWRPFPPGRLHLGLVLAVATALVLVVVLYRTHWGLALRATGDNPQAAWVCGIKVSRLQTQALLLSGMLAGLGGAVEVLGITHRLFERLSPGWGYSGIAVALVGGLQPLGTTAAALLFGIMEAGSGGMQRSAGVPTVTVLLIQGLVVVALSIRRRSSGL